MHGHFPNNICISPARFLSGKNLLFTAINLLFCYNFLHAQGSVVPLGSDAYQIIDRLEIKTGIPVPFVTGMKPYLRGDVVRYAMQLDTAAVAISSMDRRDLYWLFKDNNEWLAQGDFAKSLLTDQKTEKSQSQLSFESNKYIERKPVFRYLFKSPANAFELNSRYFHLRINPTLNFRLGKDSYDEQWQFTNLRGLQLRGGVDDKVFFYADIEETQSRFAPYVTERIERDHAIQGAHLYKPYNSRVIKNLKDGYDYAIANGYLGFNLSRHIGMQFGHGTNFLGDGYRSLLLSNNSANYLYWKINTQVGKFSYQNIFTQFSSANQESDTLRRKYMATHLLNYKPFPGLDIALFESVMIQPRSGDQFDFNYLNPVIFYRTVEYISGSNDNALLGMQLKYNFLKRFSLYGQLLLDEFNVKYLLSLGNTPQGWWANKYALQGGLKYIDVLGVDHLDTRLEFNYIRPYTYSHYESTSYSNARQPLAHPLGANCSEVSWQIRYEPLARWRIDARALYIRTGEDSTFQRPYGQNVLSPYYRFPNEFGNTVGQGIPIKIYIAGIDISYQFMHNMFAELQYFYRYKNSALDSRDEKSSYIGAGIRINIANRRMDW